MLYKKSYSVPKNTTLQAPDLQKLQISKGRIIGWIVFSPEEAADLVKLKIEYHGTQIYPFTGSEWVYGFFEPILIEDDLEIKDSPYVLDIYAINAGAKYSHEYNVHVLVEPEKPVEPGVPMGQSITDRLKELFGV